MYRLYQCVSTLDERRVYIYYLYTWSVKIRHHIHREGLEILMLIRKREEYGSLDFMWI
jgi:hypothetical protein